MNDKRTRFIIEIFNPTQFSLCFKITLFLSIDSLSRQTTDDKLKEAFSPLGHILDVITNRATGRSKGFGFITYVSIEEAEKAKEEINAKFLDGWVIFVDPTKPRESRPPSQPQPSQIGFTSNKTIGWCG
ncbi:hypothetical protein UlMin_033215 [Ulmus minor]